MPKQEELTADDHGVLANAAYRIMHWSEIGMIASLIQMGVVAPLIVHFAPGVGNAVVWVPLAGFVIALVARILGQRWYDMAPVERPQTPSE